MLRTQPAAASWSSSSSEPMALMRGCGIQKRWRLERTAEQIPHDQHAETKAAVPGSVAMRPSVCVASVVFGVCAFNKGIKAPLDLQKEKSCWV